VATGSEGKRRGSEIYPYFQIAEKEDEKGAVLFLTPFSRPCLKNDMGIATPLILSLSRVKAESVLQVVGLFVWLTVR